MRNQYFQMVFRDNQAFIHFFPPRDGGKNVTINEVTAYLEFRKYKEYNLVELNKAIGEPEQETEVLVGPWDGIRIREMMDINVSLDKMKVVCRFYPPSEGGQLMSAKEIVDDLTFHKVKHGLDQQAVFSFLQDRKYCTDYIFALGTPPVHGRDAKIEYFFATAKNLSPKHNEDGSVNYKELNTISHVHAGDLLARLTPEDPGKPGKNVYGEEIRPRTVKTAKLSYGNNITINEEGTEIVSDVTGHVNLVNGKVFVSNVFEVPADVDNSIGNIEYEGSVLIHGNVKSGFTVHASQDVIVEGVVEGADVSAGAQLIIKHGVHGMFKANLHAGTNMMVKFVENATVVVGGYLEAEQLMNSDVSSRDCIRVHGKKGLINGGVLRAVNYIEADNIGSEMGTNTTLEVGVDPTRKERYIALAKEIESRTKEIEDIKIILANYSAILRRGERLPQDKMIYVQQQAVLLKQKQTEIAPLREEMMAIHTEMMASNRAYVSVNRSIYPGAVIAISDLSLQIREITNACKFKKADGTITHVPL